MKPTFFETPQAFRAWLQRHHRSSTELLVELHRRGSEHGEMTWPQAVDQALCFGWIDGVRKRIDAERYTVRFTPRKPGSTWSAVNIRRVAALESLGSMRPAGREAFARRSEKRSATYSYERKDAAVLDAALEKSLKSDRKAWAFLQAQAPSYRRKVIHWVMSAKEGETRLRRLRRLIAAFAQGRRA